MQLLYFENFNKLLNNFIASYLIGI